MHSQSECFKAVFLLGRFEARGTRAKVINGERQQHADGAHACISKI